MGTNTIFDSVNPQNQAPAPVVSSGAEASAPTPTSNTGETGTAFDAVQASKPTPSQVEGTVSSFTPSIFDRLDHFFREAKEKGQFLNAQDLMTPAEQERHPIATGVGEFSGEMSSAENVLQLMATEGLGAVTPFLKGSLAIIPRLASAGFTGQMLYGAYRQYPAVKAAIDRGDVNEAERLLTHLTLGLGMAALAGQHAVKGSPAGVEKPTTYEKAQSDLRKNESEEFFPSKESANPNPMAPKPSKTLLRPTTKTVAGIDAPIAASQQEDPSLLTKIAGHLASPNAARDFQKTHTIPAASRQLVSTLGQRIEDINNAHKALVAGETAPDAVAGTQQPSKYQTIDDAVQASKQTVKSTWDKADAIDAQEQATYEQQRQAAIAEHKRLLDEHNQTVAEHNANLSKGDSPLENIPFDESQVAMPERPRTLAELRSAERTAQINSQSADAAIRQQAYEKDLPKAEKDLDNWFRQHEDQISPEEWSSAKNVYRTANRFQDISNKLRAPMLQAAEIGGGLTGNRLRSIEANFNSSAVKRGQSPDSFKLLLGPEAYDNWKSVSRVLDPVKGPSAIERGLEYFVPTVLAHFAPILAGAGIAGKALTEFVMNRVLFSPEWGKWFTDAFSKFKQTGVVPPDAQQKIGDLMKYTRMTDAELRKAGFTQAQIDAGVHLPGIGGGSASSVSLPTMNQFDAHLQNGGSTFTSEGQNMSGADTHAVGAYPERTQQLSELTPEHLEEFKEKNADLLNQPDHAVGTWQDPETGKHTLDVTKLIQDRDEAVKAGKAANQKAIYHLGRGETIDTGGTGEAPTPATMRMHHWSNVEGLSETDPEKMGSGQMGAERARMNEPGFQKRTNFGLDGYNEPRIQGLKFHYVADVDPTKYYDPKADPEGIWAKGFDEGGATGAEKAVKDAGYSGYRVGNEVASFEKVPVRLERRKAPRTLHIPEEAKAAFMAAVKKPIRMGGADPILEAFREQQAERAKVGTKAGAEADTDFFKQAKAKMPDASLSEQLQEAQRLKDANNAPSGKNPESEIATRNVDAHDRNAVTGWDAIEQAAKSAPDGLTGEGKVKEGYLRRLLNTMVENHPDLGVKLENTDIKDPRKGLDKIVNHWAGNLEWLHNLMPEDFREQSKQWYDTANKTANEWAQKYNTTPEKVAGVIAALSPKNAWDVNAGQAERMLDMYTNMRDHEWSDEMDDAARKIAKRSKSEYRKAINALRGKKYDEIATGDPKVDNYLKGLWLKMLDEAHGSDTTPLFHPTGRVVGHVTMQWGMPEPMAKAVQILESDGSPEAIHSLMGSGHKIRNFYNNIVSPNSDTPHTTVDTHAGNATMLVPRGSDDDDVASIFRATPSSAAAGIKGTYSLHAEAYRRAAERLGLKPRELQSITWEGIRSLMGDVKKTPELRKAVSDIWEKHREKKLTIDEARAKIVEVTGGFNKPDWMTDAEWEKAQGSDFSFGANAGGE